MASRDRTSQIRAVVFDFGGVFVAPTRGIDERSAEFGPTRADIVGFFIGPDAVEAVMAGQRFSIVDMVPAVEARLPASMVGDRQKAAELILSVYVDAGLAAWDESMEALARQVHEAGVGVGLLANGPADLDAAWFHRLEGIADATVLSGRDGVGKPSREAFELIATRLGVDLSECFFVDDNAHNIDAADELAMTTHLYNGDISALLDALRSAGLPIA
jgi:putative hydrolase of the HAD superfamily